MKLPKIIVMLMVVTAMLASPGCKKSGSGDSVNPLYNSKSQPSSEQSSAFVVAWWKQLFSFVKSERLSPPDASRMYAYLGTAIYESQICGAPDYLTLEGQLNGLKDLPRPDKTQVYDWTTVTINTIYFVQDDLLSRYIPAGVKAMNDLHDAQIKNRAATGVAADVMERSEKYGRELADAIIAWSETDNYEETRYQQYKAPTREGHPELWEPTDFNQTALEPFWGTLRTFCVKDASQCDINRKFEYSDDTSSELYKEALQVYTFDKNLTEEQRTIAQYWADDAGETSTPPGHWLSIANTFVLADDIKLDKASELWALMTASMSDVCMAIWHTKYRVDELRPKTYINEHMEKGWEPYVETPPFAGYTSGHSGFSGAASTVLTALLGDQSFIDSTNMQIGLLPRSFKSFDQAASEAGMSRIYGGIHFMCDNVDGKEQGVCTANFVLNNIKVHPKRQGNEAVAPAKGDTKKGDKKKADDKEDDDMNM